MRMTAGREGGAVFSEPAEPLWGRRQTPALDRKPLKCPAKEEGEGWRGHEVVSEISAGARPACGRHDSDLWKNRGREKWDLFQKSVPLLPMSDLWSEL